MCLGGVGSAALWMQAAGSTQVLQVAHPLARGEILGEDDVVVVTVGRVPSGSTVPAGTASRLMGKTVLADIPGGALLAPSAVGEPIIAKDRVVVGLKLAPGRIPAQPLTSGTEVLLVAVPSPMAGAEKAEGSFRGTVATATAQLPDGSLTLDVAVPSADAAKLARLAALDQISVVREAVR